MTEKPCPVCGDVVQSRIACIMQHFTFYAPGKMRYWRGNIAAFGLAGGLRGSICLSFPFVNILMNWRHRKSRVVMPPPDHG